MTGVELIVAALAVAGTAGITSGVQDAYTGLKGLLARRLAGRDHAVRALEAEETEPGVWRAGLGDDLAASGAADDEEILAAARRLLTLADPDATAKYRVDLREAKGVMVGDHNQQTNTFQ